MTKFFNPFRYGNYFQQEPKPEPPSVLADIANQIEKPSPAQQKAVQQQNKIPSSAHSNSSSRPTSRSDPKLMALNSGRIPSVNQDQNAVQQQQKQSAVQTPQQQAVSVQELQQQQQPSASQQQQQQALAAQQQKQSALGQQANPLSPSGSIDAENKSLGSVANSQNNNNNNNQSANQNIMNNLQQQAQQQQAHQHQQQNGFLQDQYKQQQQQSQGIFDTVQRQKEQEQERLRSQLYGLGFFIEWNLFEIYKDNDVKKISTKNLLFRININTTKIQTLTTHLSQPTTLLCNTATKESILSKEFNQHWTGFARLSSSSFYSKLS